MSLRVAYNFKIYTTLANLIVVLPCNYVPDNTCLKKLKKEKLFTGCRMEAESPECSEAERGLEANSRDQS